MKKSPANEVLTELDKMLLNLLEDFKIEGTGLTEEQKRFGLKVFKMSPGYSSIEKAVQNARDKDVDQVKTLIRERLSTAFRKPLLEAVKGLPHPKGGRPKLLSDDAKRKACNDVLYLVAEGVDSPDALRQVAAKFGVRLRTMQRIWKNRAQYLGDGKR